MKLIIKKSDLDRRPCGRYNDLPDEFDALEEIEKRGNCYSDLKWLIKNCKLAQTSEMLEKYLEMNKHDYKDLSWLIENCELAQTPEMVERYLEMSKGDNSDLRYLISGCGFAKKYMESRKMKLIWEEVSEGILEAKTEVGVFTIKSGHSPELGYSVLDVTVEDKHIAYAFDIGQAKRYARRKYKELNNNQNKEKK